MPFSVHIDDAAHLIMTTWQGSVTDGELMTYIEQIWLDRRVRGFCELLDFRAVAAVNVPSEAIHELAVYSRSLDDPDGPVGTAMVASDQLVYGLSRMFASIRALDEGDLREFRVFSTPEDARIWLAGFVSR